MDKGASGWARESHWSPGNEKTRRIERSSVSFTLTQQSSQRV